MVKRVEFNGCGRNSVGRCTVCNKLDSGDERINALSGKTGGVDDRNSEEIFK